MSSSKEIYGQESIFPDFYDSTFLATFNSCPRKALHRSFQGLTKGTSVDLVAGGAFAKALEVTRKAFFVQNQTSAEAVEAGLRALIKEWGEFEEPAGHVKSMTRMCEAVVAYFNHYGFDSDECKLIERPDSERGIEFSFAIPLDDCLHPVTGEPMLFTGRADAIVEYAGSIWPMDEKTTKSFAHNWAEQWVMRPQFSGYVWALRQYMENVSGLIVRGVAIQKTQFKFQQHPVSKTDHAVQQWRRYVTETHKRVVEAWESGHFHTTLGNACDEYFRPCSYKDLCLSHQPERWMSTYEVDFWNPLEEAVKLVQSERSVLDTLTETPS